MNCSACGSVRLLRIRKGVYECAECHSTDVDATSAPSDLHPSDPRAIDLTAQLADAVESGRVKRPEAADHIRDAEVELLAERLLAALEMHTTTWTGGIEEARDVAEVLLR